MLDFVFILIFLLMTFKIIRAVVTESDIYKEFEQTRIIVFLSLLFPLGPIVLLTLQFRLGWLPAVMLAILCYLPALIVSRRQMKVFEASGTDRTHRVEKASAQAFGTALLGFVYIGIYLVFVFINMGISSEIT